MKVFFTILIAVTVLIIFGAVSYTQKDDVGHLDIVQKHVEYEKDHSVDNRVEYENLDEKKVQQQLIGRQNVQSAINADEPFAREKQICLGGDELALDPEYCQSCLIAAETGDADMQYILATSYAIGLGTLMDNVQAAFWYEKAAEQGHNPAKIIVQLYYDQGIGVERDYVLSYAWLSSVEVTDDLPESVLTLIKDKDELWQRRLSRAEFREAQKLAKRFKRAYK